MARVLDRLSVVPNNVLWDLEGLEKQSASVRGAIRATDDFLTGLVRGPAGAVRDAASRGALGRAYAETPTTAWGDRVGSMQMGVSRAAGRLAGSKGAQRAVVYGVPTLGVGGTGYALHKHRQDRNEQ